MLPLLVLYALAGLSFTLGKMTLSYGNPLFYTAARMTIGGGILSTFMFLIKRSNYRPTKEDIPYFAQVTLFGIVLPYCIRAWGLQHTSATKASFIFTLLPIFTALFAYLFHRTAMSVTKAAGLALGFLGMIPTFITTNGAVNGIIGFFSLPELAVLFSVASFGYNFIGLSTLVNRRKCPPLIANALTMLIGGLISFGVATLGEPVWVIDPQKFYPLLGAQILLSNIIILSMQATLIKRYSPTLMAFACLLIPLCASLFSWLLLGEQLKIAYLVSLVMVLLGLILFYSEELAQEAQSPNNSSHS